MLQKEKELYAFKSEKSTILQWSWWGSDIVGGILRSSISKASSVTVPHLFCSSLRQYLTFCHLFEIFPCVRRSKKLLLRLKSPLNGFCFPAKFPFCLFCSCWAVIEKHIWAHGTLERSSKPVLNATWEKQLYPTSSKYTSLLITCY